MIRTPEAKKADEKIFRKHRDPGEIIAEHHLSPDTKLFVYCQELNRILYSSIVVNNITSAIALLVQTQFRRQRSQLVHVWGLNEVQIPAHLKYRDYSTINSGIRLANAMEDAGLPSPMPPIDVGYNETTVPTGSLNFILRVATTLFLKDEQEMREVHSSR
ncbi:MAG TPA: hypothetical protein VFG51_00390 [Candidatus Saccharimonadia bacterium]|nr:hypothetical protein [Candidatus Saccharimonadia bacterium]